jgi:ABC-2 type transport system ATP-binding protein
VAEELLRVVSGPVPATEIPLDGELIIGRGDPAVPYFERDDEVSRRHARVARAGAHLVLEDLGSSNGTYLNGWRIPAPQLLNPGDRVEVGTTLLELVAPEGAVSRAPALIAGTRGYEQLRPSETTSVLYATNVRKSYGELHVLKGVDIEIQPGEVVGLLGPNGAGKTTFVSIIAGVRTADEGEITVDGVDAIKNSREAREHLGIAPQDLGIYPTQTVRRNLQFFGKVNGLRGRDLAQRVEEVGEALSLTPKFDALASTLSGGQKRRLHTGMAMLHQPPLLILDEPTVGADIRTRQEILDAVKRLAADGAGICYSTHYLPEIEELGASVAILDGGQIIARGSIAELVAKHASPYVELTFQGAAPDIRSSGEVTREDSLIRIKTDRPSQVAAEAVSSLGADAARLVEVEIVRPSLDSVYLSLTERRYSAGEEPAELDAAAAPGGGTLRVISGARAGESFAVDRELLIGREGSDIAIDDPELSRRHARVRAVAGGIELEDLGSSNGTFVDGTRITTITIDGAAVIQLGTCEIAFEPGPPARGLEGGPAEVPARVG